MPTINAVFMPVARLAPPWRQCRVRSVRCAAIALRRLARYFASSHGFSVAATACDAFEPCGVRRDHVVVRCMLAAGDERATQRL